MLPFQKSIATILTDNDQENRKRLKYFNLPGNHFVLRVPRQFFNKTLVVASGSFAASLVRSNGTVNIDKSVATAQVSIIRIFPC